jgi:hypothetical protein
MKKKWRLSMPESWLSRLSSFGRAIQGRDPQAAVAIALAGISTMIPKRPFEP